MCDATMKLCVALLLMTLLAWTAATVVDPYISLEHWLQKHGGAAKARVGVTPSGLRGLFANETIPKDHDILVIPETTIINAGSDKGSVITPILTYLREVHTPYSRFLPYLATMPSGADIANACTLNPEHVKMLQAPFWDTHVEEWQQHMRQAWTGEIHDHLEYTFQEMLGDQEVSWEGVQRACAVVTTRYVHNSRGRLSLAPVFDMCNHRKDCPQYLQSDSKGALHLVAGEDLQPGDEICYGYGSMRDDYAAFYYGFLPPAEDPPRLLAVDHHQFSGEDGEFKLSEKPLTGPRPRVEVQLRRLTTVLRSLEASPVPQLKREEGAGREEGGRDEGYQLMVQLRGRRERALRYEIARLTGLLGEMVKQEL